MNAITYNQTNNNQQFALGAANYLQYDPFRSLTSPNLGIPFPNSINIILQPRKSSYQPTTLGNTTHIYTSPAYNDMINLAEYFADWSANYEIQEGPVHMFTVQVPWDTITDTDFTVSNFASEQWELIPNNESRDILRTGVYANSFVYPSVANNFVVLPDVLKVAVQRAYDNKTNFISLQSGSTLASASFIPYAQMTLDYMRFGIDSVPSYTQTLRRTAVIDERNSNGAFTTAIDQQLAEFQANTGTINFVLSYGSLINDYSIPRDTVAEFMLPSYSKLISVASANQATYKVYAGWLVKPPTFNFITRNKIQLSQEFIWNEWIDKLYFIYSPPSHFPLLSTSATSNPSIPMLPSS